MHHTVLRLVPCLFGLYSVAAALHSQLRGSQAGVRAVAWSGKTEREEDDGEEVVAIRLRGLNMAHVLVAASP
jgi:hypothetical protein